LYILLLFNNNNNEYQFRNILNNSFFNTPFNLGIDGISLPLIVLTTIIIPIIIYIREIYNKEDYKYIIKIIIIEIILIGIFIILDIFSFYILFEIILIPLFIIIIKYGKNYNKYEAAYKIFIYTFIGSIIFLISLILIIIIFGTT
jgi:NADH:ubiquinone oxidoreductase subunit 4 (subunit M)